MANFFKKTSMSISNGARFIVNIPLKILEFILNAICIILYIVGRWYITLPVAFFLVCRQLYSDLGYGGFSIKNIGPFFSSALSMNGFRISLLTALILGVALLIVAAVTRKFFVKLRADVAYAAYDNKDAIARNNSKIAELEKMGSDKDLSGYNKRKADEFKNNDNFIER